MAILYVNSITGNDSNNGSTPALAKKTLAGVNTAASADDLIFVSGIFYEVFPVTKRLSWKALGYAEVNGNGALVPSGSLPTGTKITGIVFANFLTANLYLGAQCGFDNCVFRDSVSGISASGTASGWFLNCAFINNSSAGFNSLNHITSPTIINCIFAGNAKSIYATNTVTATVQRCVFLDPIAWDIVAGTTSYITALSDYNVYNFANTKCIVAGVDRTSLASWLSAVSAPAERNSLDQSISIGDLAKRGLRPLPGANLLTQGPGGTPIGLSNPALTISNNRNSSLWTGGVFSNTELDGNGDLVLSAGQTSGYWQSDVIDFGAAIPAQRVEVSVTGEVYPTTYLDYDTGDSPNYLNVRVRGSNVLFTKTDNVLAWVTVPRGAEIGAYMSNSLRYWQIEITLRG